MTRLTNEAQRPTARPRRSPRALLALAMVAGATATGCLGAGLDGTRLAPGPVAIGGARHIVITDGDGTPEDQGLLSSELVLRLDDSEHFSVEVSDFGVFLERRDGRYVRSDGLEMRDDELHLQVDIVSLVAGYDTRTETGPEGGPIDVPLAFGEIDVRFTLVDADGVARAERVRRGASAELVGPDATDTDALVEAAHALALEIVSRFEPEWTNFFVPLDMSDPGLNGSLDDAIQTDDHTAAIAALDTRLADVPDDAVALYNRGAFADVANDFARALVFYDAALTLDDNAGWLETRRACAQRLADQDALSF